MEPFGKRSSGLVQWRIPILIGNRNKSSSSHQVLRDRLIAPETRIVQRRVSVLIRNIDVRPVPQKLRKKFTNINSHPIKKREKKILLF